MLILIKIQIQKWQGKYNDGYRSFSSCGIISEYNNDNDKNEILQDNVDAYLAVCLPGKTLENRYKKNQK